MLKIIFVFIVCIEHFYIMVLEMFFSTSYLAQKTFRLDPEFIKHPSFKVLMVNQGIYNGFLACGLVWGFLMPLYQTAIFIFFLSCIVVASMVGGYSSKQLSLFLKQGIPAIIALLLVLFI